MRRKLFLLLFPLLTFSIAWTQTRQVTGRVTKGSSSESLSGATVTIKGTNSSTTANAEGSYSISVPGPNSVLVFSYVGYKTVESSVGNRNTLDVHLEEDASTLNDVVVVGYYSVRR
jgi:hypothetical protein